MKRKFRITQSDEIVRIRQLGSAFKNPNLVLLVLPQTADHPRFAVIVGRRIGNAVVRNHLKRQIKEILRGLISAMEPNVNLVFIARAHIKASTFTEISTSIANLLSKANLLKGNSSG